MSKRSKQAAQTRDNIVHATERLLTNKLLYEIDLVSIAKEAGTTVQTVLRHMDSRDGCLQAVVKAVSARIEAQRSNSEYNSIEAIISDLTEHYESEGKLILNFLAQEQNGDAFVSNLIKKGRTYHRNWVKRCFANHLHGRTDADIDALVLATDIYSWKLLRLDIGRSRNESQKILTEMVMKILEV